MKRIISPSVLSADFGHLADDIAMLDRSEAEWIHIDVMDGVFVPNISFGFPLMPPMRKGTKKVLDTHLMIVKPERYVERFAKAGADIITVHLEATEDPRAVIELIKKCGVKAGMSIKPKTPVSAIVPYLNDLDLVLIMSVEPGFGGQSFIEHSIEKISRMKEMILKKGCNCLIEVDGGVAEKNAAAVAKAGADILVAGSAVFKADDPASAAARIKAAANA